MKKLILALLLLGSSMAGFASKNDFHFSYSYYVKEEAVNPDGGRLTVDTDNDVIRLIQGRKITTFQINNADQIDGNFIFYCTDLYNGLSCSVQFIQQNNEISIYIVYDMGTVVRLLP